MSKHNVEKTIREELGRLNEIIDQKIIRGLSYRREAEKHSFLRARLARLSHSRVSSYARTREGSWLQRSLGFVGTLLM